MTSTSVAPPAAAMPPAAAKPRDASLVPILKDALVTGAIALALAIPLVGFKTVDRGSTTLLETRFGPMLCGVSVIALGRLAFSLINAGYARAVFAVAATMAAAWPLAVVLGAAPSRWLPLAWMTWLVAVSLALRAAYVAWGERAAARGHLAPGERVAATVQRLSAFIAPILIAFAVAMPMLPFADQRWVDLGILVLTYVMLGWGLNVVVGLAGLLDLGYVAFYAVGAYSFAIFAKTFGLNFWEALPIAGLLAATFGVLLGFPVLRLRGDYLAIVTLGFGEIVRVVLLNWSELSNGAEGDGRYPAPELFRHAVQRGAARGRDIVPSVVQPACLGGELFADPACDLSVLHHPRPGAAHQLVHFAHSQAADQPRLGGAARG